MVNELIEYLTPPGIRAGFAVQFSHHFTQNIMDTISPYDLIDIDGQRYIKSEPIPIKQTLLVDTFCRVKIEIPGFISSRLLYKNMLFTATRKVDGVVRFTNDYDYWVIDYYPASTTIKYHNSLLEKVTALTEAEREQAKREMATLT